MKAAVLKYKSLWKELSGNPHENSSNLQTPALQTTHQQAATLLKRGSLAKTADWSCNGTELLRKPRFESEKHHACKTFGPVRAFSVQGRQKVSPLHKGPAAGSSQQGLSIPLGREVFQCRACPRQVGEEGSWRTTAETSELATRLAASVKPSRRKARVCSLRSRNLALKSVFPAVERSA